jgi:putative transposase
VSPLLPNDVFTLRGATYRVVQIGGPEKRLHAIELGNKTALPRYWEEAYYKSPEFQRAARIIDPPKADRPYEPSEEDKKVRTRRWHRIKELVEEHAFALLDRRTRRKLLKDYAKLHNCSDKILLEHLRLWWQGGQTQDALLGNFFRCGHIEESTPGALPVEVEEPAGITVVVFAPPTQKARGRRPTIQSYTPFSMPRDLRRQVLRIATKYFESDESKSVRGAADEVLKELFCLRDEQGKPLRRTDGKKGVQLKPRGQRPTLDQVRYLLKKTLPAAQALCKRVSPSDYQNNHAPASGSVLDDCTGPGDVYEIDATIVDLWLVAKDDRKTIIGKATLYLVVDRYSRLIVGFYLSLENPSWVEAKQAILSIAGDWQALCKRFNVLYDPNDWPAWRALCHRIFGDRGEMISFKSDVLCDGMEIPVSNPPSKEAVKKCIVESGHRTTSIALADNAPAYEPPRNAKRRRGKHYEQDACLTLDDLAALYLELVIAHNHKVLSGYPLKPAYILAGRQARPVALWNWGIEEHMGVPSRYSYEYMRQKLLPTDVGKVFVDGIHFKESVYKFDGQVFDSWASRASLGGSFPVTVAYNPALVDDIIVIDPNDSRKQFTATLTSDYYDYRGMSFAERRFIAKTKKRLDQIGADDNTAVRVGLAHEMDKVTRPAHAEMRVLTKGVKLGTRMRDGVERRKAESQQRRRATHAAGNDGAIYGESEETRAARAKEVPADSPNVISIDSARRTTELPKALSESTVPDSVGAVASPFADAEPGLMDELLNLIDQS